MSSYLNNSYIFGLFSGVTISTMFELIKTNKDDAVPLSLSAPMSLMVHKLFSNASTFLENNKKTIDKNIATLAVPVTCTTLAAIHVANKEASSIYDVALKIAALTILNKPIIQPLIRVIAPAKTLSNIKYFIDKVPFVREAHTFQKFCTSYLASLVTTQLFQKSFSSQEGNILPICQKFGILTFAAFLTADFFNFFIPSLKQEVSIPLPSEKDSSPSHSSNSTKIPTPPMPNVWIF